MPRFGAAANLITSSFTFSTPLMLVIYVLYSSWHFKFSLLATDCCLQLINRYLVHISVLSSLTFRSILTTAFLPTRRTFLGVCEEEAVSHEIFSCNLFLRARLCQSTTMYKIAGLL